MFTMYSELDRTGKLVWNFRNICHCLRKSSGGKGSQKRILTVLLKSGTVTQTALTDYLEIRPGSASEALSKMESAGLIMRVENESDHRTVNIELTEEGRKEAILATEERNRRHRDMFVGMSEKEQEELLYLLEKVVLLSQNNCKEDCQQNRKEGEKTQS